MRRFTGEDVPPVVRPSPATSASRARWRARTRFFDWLRQSYLHDLALGRRDGRKDGGARSAYARQGGFLHAPHRQRRVALEFRADQSRAAARHDREQGRESRSRHENVGRGHFRRRRRVEDPPERRQQIRARRRSSANDARQGRLAQRRDGADPICADDRRGLRAPAADHAALDQ